MRTYKVSQRHISMSPYCSQEFGRDAGEAGVLMHKINLPVTVCNRAGINCPCLALPHTACELLTMMLFHCFPKTLSLLLHVFLEPGSGMNAAGMSEHNPVC